jgi:transcriptional regulator GlxA family with amidase domain
VASEIRRQRLERGRTLLLDPTRTRPIAEVAAAVGIPNPAVFSRIFRAHYGHSPRGRRPTGLTQSPAGQGSKIVLLDHWSLLVHL